MAGEGESVITLLPVTFRHRGLLVTHTPTSSSRSTAADYQQEGYGYRTQFAALLQHRGRDEGDIPSQAAKPLNANRLVRLISFSFFAWVHDMIYFGSTHVWDAFPGPLAAEVYFDLCDGA